MTNETTEVSETIETEDAIGRRHTVYKYRTLTHTLTMGGQRSVLQSRCWLETSDGRAVNYIDGKYWLVGRPDTELKVL